MQSTNAPQASKEYGRIQDFLNSYGINVSGNTYFVDSGHTSSSDENDGLSKDFPRATIESCFTAASVLVTANNGDLIVVQPGHTEAVVAAGGLDLDIAGVTIAFMGEGEAQARVTFGTTSTADMDIGAANITLVDPKFVASVDGLLGPIDVNAADFKIINGQYRDGTNIDTIDCIVAVPAAVRMKIHGWKYLEGNAGGGTEKESHIQLNGVDDAEIFDINIRGEFNAGCFENVTDECLNIHFRDVLLANTETDPSPGMVLINNCTGIAERVQIRVVSGTTYVSDISDINWYDSNGAGIDGNNFDDPIGTAAAGGLEDKLNVPVADTSDNAYMRDVVGNKTDTSSAVSALSGSLVAYAKQLLNQHDVPAADTSDNAAMSDVVGNKTDTASVVSALSGSLVAYAKQLLNDQAVPTADTSDNTYMRDVIGNKTDTASVVSALSGSIIAYNKQLLNDHAVATADTSDNTYMRDVIGNKTDTSAAVSALSGSLVAYAKQLLNQHDVPTPDAATNVAMSDVVGNKADVANANMASDTSGSLMSYAKQLVDNGDALHKDGANYFTVTATMTQGTWSSQTAHEIAQVTGAVRVRILPEITTSLAGATSTLELGLASSASYFIGTTTATFMDASEIWASSTDANIAFGIQTSSLFDSIFVDGADIGYTVAGDTVTSGEIQFHIWWEPLNATGAVTAGLGAAF